jgi:hypothetical protein
MVEDVCFETFFGCHVMDKTGNVYLYWKYASYLNPLSLVVGVC